MTEPLFRTEPYARSARARVLRHTGDGGVVPDKSVFFPRGGGQPGDSGRLLWDGGEVEIVDAVRGEGGDIVLVPAAGAEAPAPGAEVEQVLDWRRRHAHMRVHTGLHLLSVAIGLPVTGGAISDGRGRLDFNMPDGPPDREALEAELNRLVALDLPVSESWITDAELDANPGLVKTMSVQPPRGQGKVRLIRIGAGETQIDLQPCGGTHVARTGEIGRISIGKIENKGRQNRRVNILVADADADADAGGGA